MARETAPDVAPLMERLDPLGADQYIMAFGLNERCLLGTPGGFTGKNLPETIVQLLVSGMVKKFIFASFGSDPDEWFVSFEAANGKILFRLGRGASPALRSFVDGICPPHLMALKKHSFEVRVQFGAKGSFVAWNDEQWVSSKIPSTVLQTLMHASKYLPRANTKGLGPVGQFRMPLVSLSWTPDGSYFAKFQDESSGSSSFWDFKSDVINANWNRFWGGRGSSNPGSVNPNELANVTICPHNSHGDTFAFFKKKGTDQEADFITRYAPNEPAVRLTAEVKPLHIQKAATPQIYGQIQCKRDGRSHPNDHWELLVKKGEVVFDHGDRGNNWRLCQNKRGQKGYVNVSWLDFNYGRDPKGLYEQFLAVTTKTFDTSALATFPDFSKFASLCSQKDCKAANNDGDGIGLCPHALEKVLRGSGKYTYDFIKDERTKWHPDKFARICHPEHREALKKRAECMFVFMGMLMDHLVVTEAKAAGSQ